LTGEPPAWVLLHRMPPDESPVTPFLDIHAGAGETGIVAAFYPGLVDVALAKTLAPTKLKPAQAGEWLRDARKVTPLGYVGDPARFNVEESRTYLPEWCRLMAEAIAGFMGKVNKERSI